MCVSLSESATGTPQPSLLPRTGLVIQHVLDIPPGRTPLDASVSEPCGSPIKATVIYLTKRMASGSDASWVRFGRCKIRTSPNTSGKEVPNIPDLDNMNPGLKKKTNTGVPLREPSERHSDIQPTARQRPVSQWQKTSTSLA